MKPYPIRVLLVEDDEDDAFATRELLSEIPNRQFEFHWLSDYEDALSSMERAQHDVVLMDYRLGTRTGLELMREAAQRGCRSPVILLTGQGDHTVDVDAMKAGASDYLIKGQSGPLVLERSIRYALERSRTLEALRISEERYALAMRGANDGLWDWNLRTNEVYFSSRWKAMLGWMEGEIGTDPEEWFGRVHPDDLSRLKGQIEAHLKGAAPHFVEEYRMRHRSGKTLWMLSRGEAIRDPQGSCVRMAGSQSDISARKAAEERLRHEAIHDELTGMFNRRHFMERLVPAIESAKRYGLPLSLCLCDIDHFKSINDTHGHPAGDDVLGSFATLIGEGIRASDVAARYGGDEFCVLFTHVPAQQAAVCLERIRSRLASMEFKTESGTTFKVTATFGLAGLYFQETTDKDLLEAADQALYQAKRRGRNRVYCE